MRSARHDAAESMFLGYRPSPWIRSLIYIGVFCTALYVLYYSMLPTDYEPIPFPPGTVSRDWAARADAVKKAFIHAYGGYEQYAFPSDELLPTSNRSVNNFNGWGVTAFDSLDTMLLMGLDKEFERALALVQKTDFSMPNHKVAPYFETVIRYLGGLLSAYALTKKPILLERADDLARLLDPIFNTPSRLPRFGVNTKTGITEGPVIGILAEIATLQLEYTYLAKATGKKVYFERADNLIKALARADLKFTGGMLPVGWNLTDARPVDYVLSVGAQADSAHEYLLKQYLLTAHTDKASLEMYIRATTVILTRLFYLSPRRKLLYVTDSRTSTYGSRNRPTHRFEHLSCFLPGLLALGANTLPLDNLQSAGIDLMELATKGTFGNAESGYRFLNQFNLKDVHMWAAEGLAQTCWLTYADQPTGLGPDEVYMETPASGGGSTLWIDALEQWKAAGSRGPVPGLAPKAPVVYTDEQRKFGNARAHDYGVHKTAYLLRPETVESLYLMWRFTKDAIWRERAWSIFVSIEKHCKTQSGYASIRSVEWNPTSQMDDMPSYFLAETLKYLYLIFIDQDPIPLDKWVFNTEAHPLPIFAWTENDRKIFGI